MRITIPTDLPADPAEAYRRGWADRGKATAGKGGKARKANLTPERRREIARAAVAARWAKAKAL